MPSDSAPDPVTTEEAEQKAEAAEHVTAEEREEMWAGYLERPNFFQSIAIARDGGFSEVKTLHSGIRYVSAILMVFFVFYNIYGIVTVNLAFLTCNATGADVANQCPSIFLVTKFYILRPIFNATNQQVNDNVDGSIIGGIELAILAWSVFIMLQNFTYIFWNGGNEMVQWQNVQEFFWESMPTVSTISGIKLLNRVTVQVVVPDLFEIIGFGGQACLWRLPWFIFSTLICALLGFDMLLFKIQTNAAIVQAFMEDFTSDERPGFWAILDIVSTVGVFLNQMLGIVQLNWFVRKRIFAFIFAGEDGVLSLSELALKETWESMLAQRIWRDLPWHQALVVSLSYNDYDFQMLALEDRETMQKPQEGIELQS